MHLRQTVLLVVLLAMPCALRGQALPASHGSDEISRFEAGANYNFFRANAPPGQCGCFNMNGGSGTFLVNLTPRWSALADIAVAQASHVNNTSQNIMIINYLFGPRYTYRNNTRWTPYAEVMLGGAKENVNFRFDINRQSFGVMGGGGVSTKIKPRWGINIIEVDYVYTRIPNATNNTQNNLRIATGVVYHFGG